MSIETEINRISTNVSDTLSAISEMGGEVPDGATSDDMASGVRSIPVGAKIDDTTPSSTTTYSSQKIEAEISTLNEAKANNDDLAAVAKSGSYTDLTNKPTIPTVPSALPNPNALTFTGAVNETYDGSAAKSVEIPTIPESIKNPNKLTFTGAVTAEYDGSEAVSVEIPDGGSGSYTLPIASPTTLGGVQPAAKTDAMTQAVGVDDAGGLWALPGGADSGWELIDAVTLEEEVHSYVKATDDLKRVALFIKSISTDTNTKQSNGNVSFNGKSLFLTNSFSITSSGTTRYVSCIAEPIVNYISGICTVQNNGFNHMGMTTNLLHAADNTGVIKEVSVGAGTGDNGVFGIGTTFTIYGVKA